MPKAAKASKYLPYGWIWRVVRKSGKKGSEEIRRN